MSQDQRGALRSKGWWLVLGGLVAFACTEGRPVDAIGDAMVEAGSLLRDAGSSDAAAQDGTTCRQWEITTWHPSRDCGNVSPDVLAGEWCSVPAGWEPYNTAPYSDLSGVHLRRCVTP